MATTEVSFHQYSAEQYDRDIRNSIPGHDEVHGKIQKFIMDTWDPLAQLEVLDLGCGTGLTSETIRQRVPQGNFLLVDFSQHMLNGARDKLGINSDISYVCCDYTELRIPERKFNIIASVIGLHHQSDGNKVGMFAKIRRSLEPDNGAFIFADLVTFCDPQAAALAAAYHYHHLVENAVDEKTLMEWAYHHMFLNRLAPLEDLVGCLKAVGFDKVEVLFQKFQTALIIAR